MVAQRYERVPVNGGEVSPATLGRPYTPPAIPASPPPSFRSRASSPVLCQFTESSSDRSDADRTLADTFDDGEGSDRESDGEGDERQNLMRSTASTVDTPANGAERPGRMQRRITELPSFVPPPNHGNTNAATTASTNATMTRSRGVLASGFSSSNDGVFANLDAKPELGEKLEEQPPSYEQAAADATPPYWETTILAPGLVSDEVYVDGLPVGSLFSFLWNSVISMSFQLVGFLLTYLLHTTHAAKNGSRAGLGVTLVTYGFSMKSSSSRQQGTPERQFEQPPAPNNHEFDPSTVSDLTATAVASMANSQLHGGDGSSGRSDFAVTDWLAYILMIIGWFILIRAVTDFIKARRHEQLVLQSPERGLQQPVIGEGEQSETVV